jgi:uncharacterized alpha-E superfamily protein
MTCRLLDVRYADLNRRDDFHHWLGTLKSASASEAYRKAHRASMEPANVLDFLLFSRTFPRSVLFCLLRAEADLGRLGPADGPLPLCHRLLGRIRSELEYRDVEEVLDHGLHSFLDVLQEGVRQVAEAVAAEYFRTIDDHALTPIGFIPAGAGR